MNRQSVAGDGEVNAAWFAALSPSFIADRTSVIMQDWKAHEDADDDATYGIRAFTDGLPRLQLVHELLAGGTALSLYRCMRPRRVGSLAITSRSVSAISA